MTATFNKSRDLVRSILKTKTVQSLVMNEIQSVILLFDCIMHHYLLQSIAWRCKKNIVIFTENKSYTIQYNYFIVSSHFI